MNPLYIVISVMFAAFVLVTYFQAKAIHELNERLDLVARENAHDLDNMWTVQEALRFGLKIDVSDMDKWIETVQTDREKSCTCPVCEAQRTGKIVKEIPL